MLSGTLDESFKPCTNTRRGCCGTTLATQTPLPGWSRDCCNHRNPRCRNGSPSVNPRLSSLRVENDRPDGGWGNAKIDPVSIYGPLVTSALRTWGEHRLVLALDTSVLFEKFCMIRVAVLFRGRSVPLYSTVIEHSSAQVSTSQLLPVLAHVKGMLDFLGIRDVRLLADRGFCDVDLMDWLWACAWHCRIRIKSTLILADPPGLPQSRAISGPMSGICGSRHE